MARIRTIKPEFPQSETVGRLSRDARLLFVQLWTIVDDSGRTRAASRMLASILYPYDDDAPKLIEGWLSELEQRGCIRRYEVDGTHYLDIPKWLEHQKIDRPSPSRLPEFSCELASPREASMQDLGPRTLDQGPRTKRAKGALSAEQQAEFDLWWPHYPHKAGKADAGLAFVEARRKATLEELIEGAKRYGLVLAKPNPPNPKFPQGWLNGERWKDEIVSAMTAVPSTTPSNLTPDENDRLIRLERLLGGGDWRLHHGPKPSPDEARAELAHLVAKRDGRAAA